MRCWNSGRSIGVLGLGILLGLAACIPGPSGVTRGPSSGVSPAHALSLPAYAVEGLSLDQGELAWSGIRIGTPRAELEKLLAMRIGPLDANEICASFVATRALGDMRITFEFADEGVDAPLEHLFIALQGDLPQIEQIARLKQRLPASTYVPSRYAPDLAERDNPKPVYRVATTRPRVVMLNADEGLWLGDPRCYD